MFCNAGSLAPCDTEIEVAAEVGAAIKRMESSGDLLAERRISRAFGCFHCFSVVPRVVPQFLYCLVYSRLSQIGSDSYATAAHSS